MHRLTGRVNFRRTFRGRVVLQVEEEVSARWPLGRQASTRCRWRDATVIDLTKVEMRALIDLRNRPYLPPQGFGATRQEAPAAVAQTPRAPSPAALPGAVEGPDARGSAS